MVAKKWVIERKEDTEKIFDMYINFELTKKKFDKVQRELQTIVKELDYKKSLMWGEIEGCLKLEGKTLTISDKNIDTFNKIVIEEVEDRQGDIPDILKRLLGGGL